MPILIMFDGLAPLLFLHVSCCVARLLSSEYTHGLVMLLTQMPTQQRRPVCHLKLIMFSCIIHTHSFVLMSMHLF